MEILRRSKMEFITVEQFKEQSIEVQKVFLDWWNPSIGDIFSSDILIGIGVITSDKFNKEGYISLLTEGQLRKFIEDKLEQIHYENDGRKIELDITHNNGFTCIEEGVYGSAKGVKRVEWIIENELGKKYNLLQAYWKVACIVAKEEVDEEYSKKNKEI
jgi:hypothetical protein